MSETKCPTCHSVCQRIYDPADGAHHYTPLALTEVERRVVEAAMAWRLAGVNRQLLGFEEELYRLAGELIGFASHLPDDADQLKQAMDRGHQHGNR